MTPRTTESYLTLFATSTLACAQAGWVSAAGPLPPPDHPTKGSVVVRYRGRQPGRPVLFMGHLDVVEAMIKAMGAQNDGARRARAGGRRG